MNIHSSQFKSGPLLLVLVFLAGCSAARQQDAQTELAVRPQTEAGRAAGNTSEHAETSISSSALVKARKTAGPGIAASDGGLEDGASIQSNRPPKMLGTGFSLFNLLIKEPILRPVSSTKRLIALTIGTAGRVLNPSVLPGSPVDPLPEISTGEGMNLAAWEAELDRVTKTKQSRGRIEYLIGGNAFFGALEGSIESAKSSIDIRTYIFDNDDYAVQFSDRLKKLSNDVEIRVLLDGIGTLAAAGASSDSLPEGYRGPNSIKRYLRKNSEISVRIQPNPWLTGDHTKAITVDDKTAYVGGMNIGREYRYDWHDMMMKIEGPVVQELTRDFDKAWAKSGFFRELGSLAHNSKPIGTADEGQGYPLRILRTKVDDFDILKAQIGAIRNAKKYIYIENAYFADNRILRELVKARRRGVDVRVIMPLDNDNGLLRASNVVTANVMFENGIRVFFYPGMSHIKAAVYDGWACLGSANFDNLSLRVNQELNIATSHKPAVDRLLEELFEADFAKSREMTERLEEGSFDRLAEVIANHL